MDPAFPFLKGHGTENDFVLLPDADGTVHGSLSRELVSALCNRRAGIGGDGVIRVVRSEAYDDPAAVAARGDAEWFMDYRNADGSLSQMCGNGIRVLARYLAEHEGVDPSQPLRVGTRDGVKVVRFVQDSPTREPGLISVDLGTPRIHPHSQVSVGSRSWSASHVDLGNPHAVAFVDSLEQAGSLESTPSYDEGVYPGGVNVEFVVRRGERHVAMRVHERGSGETRSCGTGACAVMVAAAIADGLRTPTGPADEDLCYQVDVAGGRLWVTWTTENRVWLTGPAVVLARGEVSGSLAGTPRKPLARRP